MSKNIIKTLTYGAVEDIDVTLDNPYVYTGYCKKLGSDEICEIEVFINDELVDTLKADALIQSVDKTYSCGKHCFVYEADKELFDQGNVIRFKQGGEDILGSPMVIKYNEHCFMQSLKESIDEEKIKDMYTPNAIGFLATEENLADEEFVGYIKELMERFPDVEFKGFCFNQEQIRQTQKLFNNRVQMLIPKDIYEVAAAIEVYIFNNHYPKNERKLFHILRYYAGSLATIQFASNMKLIFLENETLNHPAIKYPEKFKVTQEELKLSNNNFYKLFYQKTLNLNFDNQKTIYELLCLDTVKYVVKNANFKEAYYQLNKLVIHLLGIKP